ncbi:amidohydrolase family protein [Bradyrhizobium sp. ARR65]|uniref:amidohydrolase family protein n=1 Tax=Bradyrhizobium sp. ARR65 TaxID=1040989 RepID=UPI00046775ED|nr:amidohydrolase family protein [Bradyrhizobium sp. ARR65]
MTQVPNSSGTARPKTAAPAEACDSHCHVLDPRFPTPELERPAGMTAADYRQFQSRIGTSRVVFVQAKYHRTDHACLLNALERFGENARGIGVCGLDVTDGELKRLDSAGIRGLRFSVWNPKDTVTTIDMIEPLARRIADIGWHVQLHMSGDQIVDTAAMLGRLPCPIVFDHMGRLPPQQGPDHPAFRVILDLVDKGRAWVKLAGAYLNTTQGPPAYADATRTARAFVANAPERLVWGSDWPHVTEKHKPDDAQLFDLLAVWADDGEIRSRILVDNPAKLYGFE